MNVTSYIHPIRTYLPCTGVGRHINQLLSRLNLYSQINLDLLVSQQWLGEDGQLAPSCPLRDLPIRAFPMMENSTERQWKLLGFPRMDKYVADEADWLYAPMETYLPVSKCPVAVTIHDVQAFESDLPWSQTRKHRWFRYKWGRWVRRTLSHSRVVFTVSEFSKQRMVDLLAADPDKIVVVGNGIDQPFFDVANNSSQNLPHSVFSAIDSPYVFMIGGLREKKGGDHFLAVAKRLHQRGSDIKIIIGGSSEPDYIKAADDVPNIVLLGRVPDQDLPGLMRRSLCLLFLSLYEGFGIPPLEAMAAGTPAVVSDRASLPEIVGDAGVVVDPANTREIVEILMNFQRDRILRDDYIQRGYQHAKQYTWEHCTDRLVYALEKFA